MNNLSKLTLCTLTLMGYGNVNGTTFISAELQAMMNSVTNFCMKNVLRDSNGIPEVTSQQIVVGHDNTRAPIYFSVNIYGTGLNDPNVTKIYCVDPYFGKAAFPCYGYALSKKGKKSNIVL